MFPVELLQRVLQGSQELPPPSAPTGGNQFTPIPFEGGLPSPGKGGASLTGGLGGLPNFGAQNGIMPFQRDAMMQAVLGRLSQPNFGVPQVAPRQRRPMFGGVPGGFGGGLMGGGSQPRGPSIYARR